MRWRPAPMCSDPVAANSSTARAPSIGPQRKSLNRKTGGSRRSSSAGDFCENEMAAAAGHARCQFAARASAPLHQGIKTTIAPAGNVEARGWRRESAADHCVTTLKSDPVTVTDRVRHVPLFKKAEAAMRAIIGSIAGVPRDDVTSRPISRPQRRASITPVVLPELDIFDVS